MKVRTTDTFIIMAKPVAPLTDRRIKLAKPSDKLYRISDGNGLCIKILTSGSKIWEYRYVNPSTGKQDTLVLGNYPEITLADARETHKEKRMLVLNNIDPKVHEESRASFREVFEQWYAQWAPRRDKKYSEQAYRFIQDNCMRYLGHMKVDEIGVTDIVRALRPFIQRGTYETAKRMKSVLSQTIDYAMEEMGLLNFNVAKSMSNAFIPEYEKIKDENGEYEDRGYRWLQLHEVYKLHEYLNHSRSEEVTRLAAELMIRTVSRPGVLCRLRWSYVDFDRKVIEIPGPEMKKDNPHVIPITKQIKSILHRAKEYEYDGYIFPRQGVSGDKPHLSEGTPRNSLRAFNLPTTAHGFRKTASSFLYETVDVHGLPDIVIEDTLAHIDSNKSRESYKKSQNISHREILLNLWNGFIDACTTEEENKKQLEKYNIR